MYSRGFELKSTGGRWKQFLGVVGPHKTFHKIHVKYSHISLLTVLITPSEHRVPNDV